MCAFVITLSVDTIFISITYFLQRVFIKKFEKLFHYLFVIQLIALGQISTCNPGLSLLLSTIQAHKRERVVHVLRLCTLSPGRACAYFFIILISLTSPPTQAIMCLAPHLGPHVLSFWGLSDTFYIFELASMCLFLEIRPYFHTSSNLGEKRQWLQCAY